MNENDKLIQEQFNKLPHNLQLAINTVPWKDLIKEIAVANNLSAEQSESFEKETLLILYGFDSPENYIENLILEVNLQVDTATTLTEMSNEKIFKVIAAEAAKVPETTPPAKPAVPEIPPANLPMVEKGEVVHEVPHVEQPRSEPIKPIAPIAPPPAPQTPPPPKLELKKPQIPTPDYRYAGKDPYREALK